jgi:hypothetical protein
MTFMFKVQQLMVSSLRKSASQLHSSVPACPRHAVQMLLMRSGRAQSYATAVAIGRSHYFQLLRRTTRRSIRPSTR